MKFIKNRLPIIIFTLVYFIFSIFTYKSYGITNDENEEYFLGKLFYIKLIADDPILEHDFVIDKGTSNLYKYNRIYQAVLYVFNESEKFEIYHLLNLLFASVIFIFSYEVMLRIYKRPGYAILGPIFLIFMPRFFGHMAGNPKDVPFAISYFISLALILMLKKHDDPRSILLLGISFGFTQSLRIIGLSIYVVYFVYLLLEFLETKKRSEIFSILSNYFFRFLIIFMLGFFINMLTLPYLGADPLGNFVNLVKSSNKFPWTGQVLFNSKLIGSTDLPWYYLPTWILITTPVATLLLFFKSVSDFKKWNRLDMLFWIGFLVNIVIFFALKPIIYDGLRHMLFLLPMIAVLAVSALIKVLQKKSWLRNVSIAVVTGNFVLVFMAYIQLFPYQYVYFNEIVGGFNSLKNVENRFELDYWGASYKEATVWLNKNADFIEAGEKFKVVICGDPAQFNNYADKERFELVFESSDADYAICHIRGGNDGKVEGFSEKVFGVERMGVELNGVWKR